MLAVSFLHENLDSCTLPLTDRKGIPCLGEVHYSAICQCHLFIASAFRRLPWLLMHFPESQASKAFGFPKSHCPCKSYVLPRKLENDVINGYEEPWTSQKNQLTCRQCNQSQLRFCRLGTPSDTSTMLAPRLTRTCSVACSSRLSRIASRPHHHPSGRLERHQLQCQGPI